MLQVQSTWMSHFKHGPVSYLNHVSVRLNTFTCSGGPHGKNGKLLLPKAILFEELVYSRLRVEEIKVLL